MTVVPRLGAPLVAVLVTVFALVASAPADAQSRRKNADRSTPLLYPPGHSKNTKSEKQDAESALFEEFGHFLQRLERLEDEIAKLGGITEEQGLLIKRLREEQKRRYLDIDRRLTSASIAPSGFAGDEGFTEVEPYNPDNDDYNYASEEEAFDAAFSKVRHQNFIGASNAFQALLLQFPEGNRAPDALFWLGEIYLALPTPQTEESRLAFTELVERFPKHKRVPDALYKLGHIHDQFGERNRSDYYMNKVIEDYPQSSAAKLASAYLEKPG